MMKHSKTRRPDKPNPLLNLYLSFVAVCEHECAGVRDIPSRTGTEATTQQQRANRTRLAMSGQSGSFMGR